MLALLFRLVVAGNSMLVVEHHVQLISTADRIIELGPEGRQAGGDQFAEGTPAQVSQVSCGYTGKSLRALGFGSR